MHILKKITGLATFLSTLIVLFNSCGGSKLQTLHELKHTVTKDTISHADIYFTRGGKENKMIDIKLFNDTIFLFVIPDTKDTVRFLTYFWNGGFKYLKTYYLPDEQSRIFKEGAYYSLAVINPDSIVIAGNHNIAIYNLKDGDFCFEYTWQAHEHFQSLRTPIQWHNPTKMIFSEYLDFSKPKSKMGITQTGLFTGIDIYNNSLFKIPILTPENSQVLNSNYLFHFTLTKSGLLCKHSILNEFILYDFSKKETGIFDIPALNNLIDTQGESDLNSYDLLRDSFMKSFIQKGLCHDIYANNTILFYLEPVPERDETGKKPTPFHRGKLFYVFDNELNLVGQIRLEADTFYPSLFFSIQKNIFIIEVRQTHLIIKKISYES